ncbi:SMP-30/gluconolactonase/LRE family protein [Paraconexibacter sp.]|uniref:SMP-30/gluconolactonase/LRE family protein n=1 Tax=Paraconexibacter sp. TaxID=2949640 RepID=UPI00356B5821
MSAGRPFGLETVACGGYGLTEAPRIAGDGTVWFSDVTGGGVFRIPPGADAPEVVVAERRGVGGLVLHEDGIVVSGRDLLHVRADGSQHVLFAPDEDSDITGFNDCHVDANGWLLAGAMRFRPMRGEQPGEDGGGYVLVVGPTFVAVAIEHGVDWPNGIGLAPDGRTAYVCDYQHSRVLAVGVDGDGALDASGATFASAPEGWGCDGLAVDSEGGVWVAGGQGGGLLRFAPDGTLAERHDAVAPFVASLAFGGTDGRDVAVTVTGGPAGGEVLRGRADVRGVATPVCTV